MTHLLMGSRLNTAPTNFAKGLGAVVGCLNLSWLRLNPVRWRQGIKGQGRGKHGTKGRLPALDGMPLTLAPTVKSITL